MWFLQKKKKREREREVYILSAYFGDLCNVEPEGDGRTRRAGLSGTSVAKSKKKVVSCLSCW